jgi:hypothetical protein
MLYIALMFPVGLWGKSWIATGSPYFVVLSCYNTANQTGLRLEEAPRYTDLTSNKDFHHREA